MMLAIDYGTSNSLAVIARREGISQPLRLDAEAVDPTVFRSLIFFPDSKICHMGQRAIEEYQRHTGQGRFIRSIKKFLPSPSFLGSWIEDRVVKIEDLVGIFLLEIKRRAEAELGQPLERVMLGRPAQYDEDVSRDQLAVFRMRKAAGIAGFKDIHFFEEPIAAAVDFKSSLQEWKKVLVVDLGGGTSDFTVMRMGPEEFKLEHVLARGAVSVAGDAVDGRLMSSVFAPSFGSEVEYRVPMSSNLLRMPRSLLDKICSPAEIAQLMQNDYMYFLKQVEKWATKDRDRVALRRLFTLCEDQLGFAFFEKIEAMKKAMRENETYAFDFSYPEIELRREVTWQDYTQAIAPPVEIILIKMDEIMKQAQVRDEDIDFIYCTGGTSRLNQIQDALKLRFGSERVRGGKHFHSVVTGLGTRARQLLMAE